MLERLKDRVKKFSGMGLVALGGALWFVGGQDKYAKAWRRVGVAVIVTLVAAFKIGFGWGLLWVPVLGLLAFGAYSVGYGIPDSTDAGSSIAQFWERWFSWQFEEDKLRAATRATTGFLYGLVYLALGIVIGHWWQGLVALVVSTVAIPTITHFRFPVKREATLIGTLLIALLLMV